jgi:hypothetical protein
MDILAKLIVAFILTLPILAIVVPICIFVGHMAGLGLAVYIIFTFVLSFVFACLFVFTTT